MCACINVSPNHAIPKIAITARIPAWNTEPLVISVPSGLQVKIINAPIANMMISIVCAIPIGLPSNTGRKDGTAPMITTSNEPNKNKETEILAVLLTSTSLTEVVEAKVSAYFGSVKRR